MAAGSRRQQGAGCLGDGRHLHHGVVLQPSRLRSPCQPMSPLRLPPGPEALRPSPRGFGASPPSAPRTSDARSEGGEWRALGRSPLGTALQGQVLDLGRVAEGALRRSKKARNSGTAYSLLTFSLERVPRPRRRRESMVSSLYTKTFEDAPMDIEGRIDAQVRPP